MPFRCFFARLLLVNAFAFPVGRADAAVVITLTETQTSVIGDVSGTLNLDGLLFFIALNDSPVGVVEYFASFGGQTAGTFGSSDGYVDIGGALQQFDQIFATGRAVTADVSGDHFSLSGSTIYVPSGYESGGAISGQFVFSGETFASLGIVGNVISVATLSNGDTITVNTIPFSGTAIPVPASALLFVPAVGVFAGLRRRRTMPVGE